MQSIPGQRAIPQKVGGLLLFGLEPSRLDLTSVAAEAPAGATLVIFHTAVLAWVAAREERTGLAKAIALIRATCISNEAPAFSPCHDEKVKAECPVGQFLLAEKQRAIAHTDPHGRSIQWLPKPD